MDQIQNTEQIFKEAPAAPQTVVIAITAASYSGNKGAAAMLQSSISQLRETYGDALCINLMSVYPKEDARQCLHDFVQIVPAQPQRLVFFAFPCAVLYHFFSRCSPVRSLLLQNKILKAYAGTQLVVDEAGIAFSDNRGWVMNTYAFVCGAVPLLMGVPLVKYSQALGPFCNRYNRFLAGRILPKAQLVIARGASTYENLRAAGLDGNAVVCADGAFTMPARKVGAVTAGQMWEQCGFKNVVGVSISSVVARKCKKAGIDYVKIMAAFIRYLVGRGYQVYLFANAARVGYAGHRNNDLPLGGAVYQAYQRMAQAKRGGNNGLPLGGAVYQAYQRMARKRPKKVESGKNAGAYAAFRNGVLWEHREMDAEEIRENIGYCRLLVASRFHAMVFALSMQLPVMLVGWSHKYGEVMEQFGLGAYAADYSALSLDQLEQSFEALVRDQDEIRRKLAQHLPAVQESSRQNVQQIIRILGQLQANRKQAAKAPCCAARKTGRQQANRKQAAKAPGHAAGKRQRMNRVIDLRHPRQYIGPYLGCAMGYASDRVLREKAASGGMVTALLCSLLKNGDIDGAWVVKTAFTADGELTYRIGIATTQRQIRDASSSVYMNIPFLAHIGQLRQFPGRVAVVLTPCMMRAFLHILEKDDALRRKVVLKIGLFCSGCHDRRATEFVLDKCRIPRDGAMRLYYRTGHWRGVSSVQYQDGKKREFSYTKSVCAYKNAYFFINKACLGCKDQFAEAADISFGDVWLPEVKKDPVKYTGCVVRTKTAGDFLRRAAAQGELRMRRMTAVQMLRSQKRALTFKYRGQRWNHRLAGWLAARNREFSFRHPQMLKRVPMKAVYYYMCLIRVLLSW